jgi:hypothetical protein
MKHLCILLLVCITSLSCVTDRTSDDVDTVDLLTNYDAITLDRPTFEASVTLEDARSIINSGKIYVFNGLLFVNEKNKGFHVFDNENPSSPIALAYIKAPGATDLAIKNEVYYINQAVDLIAVTYDKQTANLQVTKRIREVFPPKVSPDGFVHNIPDEEIIIDYELED